MLNIRYFVFSHLNVLKILESIVQSPSLNARYLPCFSWSHVLKRELVLEFHINTQVNLSTILFVFSSTFFSQTNIKDIRCMKSIKRIQIRRLFSNKIKKWLSIFKKCYVNYSLDNGSIYAKKAWNRRGLPFNSFVLVWMNFLDFNKLQPSLSQLSGSPAVQALVPLYILMLIICFFFV